MQFVALKSGDIPLSYTAACILVAAVVKMVVVALVVVAIALRMIPC